MLFTKPPVEILPELLMLGVSAYLFYLVRGENEGLLFEGGISAVGDVLRRQLAERGLAEGYIRRVVITHGHPDHVMAVPGLRAAFPGIKVLASAVAAQTLATEKAIAAFNQIDEALTGALRSSGQLAPEAQAHPPTEKLIPVDLLLGEGDRLEIDSLSFQVLATPGHSDCGLSFFEPRRGILVVSDATGYYLPEHHEWWPNYFADYGAYLASMERLAALGSEVLCLSHNAAIRGQAEVRCYFEEAIAATRRYHERILAAARAGQSVRQIGAELGNEVFAKAPLLPLEFFQKNCALLAKLSLKYAGESAA
jgi:glyoxylase-like metal-dependent hydrolase (beta-lactamase superfamily II)